MFLGQPGRLSHARLLLGGVALPGGSRRRPVVTVRKLRAASLITDTLLGTACLVSLAAVGLVLVVAGQAEGAAKGGLIGAGVASVVLSWTVCTQSLCCVMPASTTVAVMGASTLTRMRSPAKSTSLTWRSRSG